MTGGTLGERLKQARRELSARRGRDVTQAEIASEVGVSQVTVGRYENNQKEPSLDMLRALSRSLGVSPGYLAFGEVPAPVVAPAVRPGTPAEIHMEDFSEGRIPERPRAAVKRTRGQAG